MIASVLRKLTDKYKKNSQLKKNILSGTVFSVGNAVVGLISYPIYLKYLGAEEYGLWTVITTVFTFSQFGQVGIERAVMKYVASEYGEANFGEITGYISTAFYILLLPSLLVISFLAFFKAQVADFIRLNEVFREDGLRLFFLVGVLSAFSFFANVIKAVVVGIGRMDIANNIALFGRILQVVVNIFLFMAGLGIWSLYYGFVVFYVVPFVLWGIFLKRKHRIRIFNFRSFSRQKMKELMKYGGTLAMGMIAQMLVSPFNKIIIGRFVGLSEVAYYQIALQVVLTARSLFVAGLEAIMPKVSEIYGKGIESISKILSIHKKAMKVVLLFGFPMLLGIFVFSDLLLKLWLGEQEFNMHIVFILRILLVGWFVHSLAVPDYFMFLGIGKVGYGVGATCIRGVANVIVIFILLLLNLTLTLDKVVLVDSASLAVEAIFLKYKFYEFKRLNRVAEA